MVTRSRGDAVFRALADPVRRAIAELLAEGPLSVRQISRRFAVTRPAISRHLRILRECGLVAVEARGRERLHTLVREELLPLAAWLQDQLQDQLQDRLQGTLGDGSPDGPGTSPRPPAPRPAKGGPRGRSHAPSTARPRGREEARDEAGPQAEEPGAGWRVW